MFEKCEQATENPDILLAAKETNLDYNNNRITSNSNGHKQPNEKSNNYASARPQNERASIDQELNFFLKENEHILFERNFLRSTLKSTQNEMIQEINSSLDEMV
jgi:hypothetical protein